MDKNKLIQLFLLAAVGILAVFIFVIGFERTNDKVKIRDRVTK